MKKIKQFLNPLNLSDIAQYKLLSFTEKYTHTKKDKDMLLKGLKSKGEMKTFSLSYLDFKQVGKSKYNTAIIEDMKSSKYIFISIEVLKEDDIKKFQTTLNYINSHIQKDRYLNVKYTITPFPQETPIQILLTGCKNSDKFLIEFGINFENFFIQNHKYTLKKIKERRKKLSKKLHHKVKPIRLIGNHPIANAIIIKDIQTQKTIKEFEFNKATKKEFKSFLKILEEVIKKY